MGIEAVKIAKGVHVGQSDMPYEIARKLQGPEAIISLSMETWEDGERAEGLDCDYLGISPVFATPTQDGHQGTLKPVPG